MTPEEKAKELVDNFKGIVYPYIGSSMLTNDINEGVILRNAKICANIVVDQIIETNPLSPYIGGYFYNITDRADEVKRYWEKVKEEITKL